MNKSERKRMLCVSLAAGAILLCGVLLVLLMRYQHTSAVRPQDQYVGQIPAFYSTVDADGDGVDDQTDVLDNALAYVDTRPKYRSRYYQTGYPDDGYGVCTDVVAFALNAGAAGRHVLCIPAGAGGRRYPGASAVVRYPAAGCQH